MINIITGRPGSGKTYVLTRYALEYLKKGLQVYSNYKINWEGDNLHYWLDTKDLRDVENGIIIMDEAHVYFNSRRWDNLSTDMQRKLQQHRKEGLHIWGSCQHEARIDVVFRELVSSFYQCKKMITSRENAKKPFGLICVSQYYPEDLKSQDKKAFSRKYYTIKKKYCEAYNTLEKIDVPPQEGKQPAFVETCKECGKSKFTRA